MKELVCYARNLFATVRPDGTALPMVELCLVVSEPRHTVDEAGGIVKTRTMETLRVQTSPEGLRQLGKFCEKIADEADQAFKTLKAFDEPEEKEE